MYKQLNKIYEIITHNKYFLYAYISIFFVTPQIKFLNLKLNIFDTGLYVSNLYSIFNIENLNGIFLGHAQLILFPLSYIFLLTEKYVINFLLILQSLCLISPIFFFKENKKKFLYLIFFPNWYINYNGFHIDCLIIPFIYFYMVTEGKSRYYFLIPLIFIKEIFVILVISLLFYEVFKIKKLRKNLLLLIIFCSLISFLLFQIVLSEIQNLKVTNFYDFIFNLNNLFYFLSLFNLSDYTLIDITKKFFLMSVIFIPFLFINFKKRLFYFVYIPIFSIYFFLDNVNFLKPYFHYSTFLIPFIFFICIKELISSKRRIFFYLLINIIFTINFLNPIFYLSNIRITENYNINNYLNLNNYRSLNNFLKDIHIPDSEPLSVSNNLLHYKVVNRNFLLVTDFTNDLDSSFTACRNLENKFNILNTKKCKIKSKFILLNKKDSKKYNDILLNLKNFEIMKQNNEFIFYRLKNFKTVSKN